MVGEMEKRARLEKLNGECAAYFDALYAPDRKVYVFGDGDAQARIVLVGEAPGEQETLLGKPFVGKAGRNLDAFLEMSGLRRAELYITNAVKFRPVKVSEKGRASNRTPTREEVGLFLPWLRRELEVLRPEVIVTLGNVPLRALMGNGVVIGQVHGELAACEAGRVFPLYHPASIVYNPSLREVYERDVMRFGQLARESGWTVE